MNMDWLELLGKIFEVCIIPLLGILTTYFVSYIKTKREQVVEEMDNELGKKYISMLFNTVSDCVIATNQTYVEALKKEGRFDVSAQKVAFQKTYVAVLNILSYESKSYLEAMVGDLESFIKNLIEAEVNRQK